MRRPTRSVTTKFTLTSQRGEMYGSRRQNESCFLPYSSVFSWWYCRPGAGGQGWSAGGTGVSELMEGMLRAFCRYFGGDFLTEGTVCRIDELGALSWKD